jgi:hypothetical protein
MNFNLNSYNDGVSFEEFEDSLNLNIACSCEEYHLEELVEIVSTELTGKVTDVVGIDEPINAESHREIVYLGSNGLSDGGVFVYGVFLNGFMDIRFLDKEFDT